MFMDFIHSLIVMSIPRSGNGKEFSKRISQDVCGDCFSAAEVECVNETVQKEKHQIGRAHV